MKINTEITNTQMKSGKRNWSKGKVVTIIREINWILKAHEEHGILYLRESKFLEKQKFNMELLLDTWEAKAPLGETPKEGITSK